MSIRIGNGLDVHAFEGGEDRPLVLGGVQVRPDGGLAGHSDADVVAHAVADALLGATALGDLGSRFGVDEPEVAGANSMELLGKVVADVLEAGWRPWNCDVTVVAQGPRLAMHRDTMRGHLARVLIVDPSFVSVKFTTTDRLGTFGRGEGIGCWATVTVTDHDGDLLGDDEEE